MTKKGRPKKAGPRHPGGQLIQAADRDAIAWRRILDDAIRLGLNPLVATQLGRLGALGQLAAHEVETGFRIAEIYGRYDKAMGRRRSAASPSYESGHGRDTQAAESVPQRERAEAAIRAYGALQPEIRLCPRGVKSPLEELCIEDRVCPPGWLPAVKIALDMLSVSLGIRRRQSRTSAPTRAKRDQSGQRAVFASIADKLVDMPEEQAAALWNHFKELLSEEEYQRARRERDKLRRRRD